MRRGSATDKMGDWMKEGRRRRWQHLPHSPLCSLPRISKRDLLCFPMWQYERNQNEVKGNTLDLCMCTVWWIILTPLSRIQRYLKTLPSSFCVLFSLTQNTQKHFCNCSQYVFRTSQHKEKFNCLGLTSNVYVCKIKMLFSVTCTQIAIIHLNNKISVVHDSLPLFFFFFLPSRTSRVDTHSRSTRTPVPLSVTTAARCSTVSYTRAWNAPVSFTSTPEKISFKFKVSFDYFLSFEEKTTFLCSFYSLAVTKQNVLFQTKWPTYFFFYKPEVFLFC